MNSIEIKMASRLTNTEKPNSINDITLDRSDNHAKSKTQVAVNTFVEQLEKNYSETYAACHRGDGCNIYHCSNIQLINEIYPYHEIEYLRLLDEDLMSADEYLERQGSRYLRKQEENDLRYLDEYLPQYDELQYHEKTEEFSRQQATACSQDRGSHIQDARCVIYDNMSPLEKEAVRILSSLSYKSLE